MAISRCSKKKIEQMNWIIHWIYTIQHFESCTTWHALMWPMFSMNCHIHQKMLLFGLWVCTLDMYSYEAVVKLKHQTSARISTKPAKQNLCERILAEMSGFTVNRFLSALWCEQQVIQNINCPFMPCEDGVQLADFTEKYSKDGEMMLKVQWVHCQDIFCFQYSL